MADEREPGVETHDLRDVVNRLDRQEQQLLRLRNTLKGVARHVDNLSVNGQCDKCGESLLLVTDGQIHCPHCNSGKTL